MVLTLGDAFSRRKQIESEISIWKNRLPYSNRDSIQYNTKAITGDEQFIPIPGSKKEFFRKYSIEEIREKLDILIKEDIELALRINKTNQVAKATITDLDDSEKEYTIPELLVLKNNIAPKLEDNLREIPLRQSGVEILEKNDDQKFIKYRTVYEYSKNIQEMGPKGQIITNKVTDYFDIQEITDYGLIDRTIYDEIDKIHLWAMRLKEAINQANKTPLVELN